MLIYKAVTYSYYLPLFVYLTGGSSGTGADPALLPPLTKSVTSRPSMMTLPPMEPTNDIPPIEIDTPSARLGFLRKLYYQPPPRYNGRTAKKCAGRDDNRT